MKLSTKLPLLFLFVALLMLLATVYVSYSGKTNLKSATTGSIEREATLLIRLIERNLFERYHDAQAFRGSLPPVDSIDFSSVAASKYQTEKLDGFISNYKVYRKILITDLDGNIINQSTINANGKVLEKVQLSREALNAKEWYQAAANGVVLDPKVPDSSYVIGPERALIDDKANSYDMVFASLIRDEFGTPLGLWINIVDFEVVESIVAETYELLADRGFVSSELTILDKDGLIIVDYDPVGQSEPIYERDFEVLGNLNLALNGVEGARLAIAGLSGSNISRHFRKQVDQVTGFAHSDGAYDYKGLGWSALIRVEEKEAFSAADQLFQYSLLLAAFSVLVILAIAFYLARFISRPIEMLSVSIRKLADGGKEVVIPKLGSSKEISEISNELTRLRDIVVERENLSKLTDEQQFKLDIQSKAIDSTATGIIVTDETKADSPIVFTNRAFERMSGYTQEEVLGKNCRFLQGEDREQRDLETLKNAIDKRMSCSVVLRNYRKDGTLFFNNLRIDPVFSQGGTLTQYIGVLTDITELVNKENASKRVLEEEIQNRTLQLSESEGRMRTVFDTALDGTAIIDQQGKVVDANRVLEKIFGYKRDELIGKNINCLMPSYQAEKHDQYLTSYMESGDKKLIGTPRQLIGLRKDNLEIPIEVSVGEMWDSGKQYFVGMVKDVSHQKENEKREAKLQRELKEREVIYRTAFDQAAVGICRLSKETEFLEVNERLCELLGFSDAELMQTNFLSHIHESAEHAVQSEFARISNLEHSNFSLDLVLKNRPENWVSVSASSVMDEASGQAKYFVVAVQDITASKNVEIELREEQVANQQLILGMKIASDAANICNWAIDIDTGKVTWDSNMYALYGIPRDQKLYLEDWKKLIHVDDLSEAMFGLDKAIYDRSSFDVEYRIINRMTGLIHWVKSSGDVALNNETGRNEVFGVHIDISEVKESQIALERESRLARQANEAKSRFLATMSHEIRTPMNGVIGMIDLLRDTSLTDDQLQMVSTIRDSSFSLLTIINDILDFSKIEAGKLELEVVETDVIALLESTVDLIWTDAYNKNVDVYLYVSKDVPERVNLDPVRTKQLVLNIIGNAVKFSNQGSKRGCVKIRLDFESRNSELKVSIQDNGIGMTKEQLFKLFKPFSQADNTTTRRFGGTGLGLSITKSLIEKMNGDIDVQSTFGQGTKFLLTIPTQVIPFEPSAKNYNFDNCIFEFSFDDIELHNLVNYTLANRNALRNHPVESEAQVIEITNRIEDFEQDTDKKVLYLSTHNISGINQLKSNIQILLCRPFKLREFLYKLAILTGQESPEINWNGILKSSESQEASENDKAQAEQFTLLCAEDNETNRLVLSEQLKKLGYKFDIVEDGQQAFELWQERDFDLILTDCHMPVMDGFELTKNIREQEQDVERNKIPIIAITANALVGESENCIAAGMDDYIAKPVDFKRLKSVLKKYLSGEKSCPILDEHTKVDEVINDIADSEYTDDGLAVLSLEHLAEVIGTEDRDLFKTVLSLFWESIERDTHQINAAIEMQDTTEIKNIAHAAKGSSRSSGALAMGAVMEEIEKHSSDIEMLRKYTSKSDLALKELKEKLSSEGFIDEN